MAFNGQSLPGIRGFVLLYTLLATIVLYLLYSNYGYDDPYITYRYAENLIHGHGFVYNPGQPILSTTTPLFTLTLALMGRFWSDLPQLANLLGAFSIAVGALFLWDLAHTWNTPLVGWITLLLYPTFPLLLTTIGSETPLYIALTLGCFASYARRRYTLAAGLAALTVLTRPDGLLVPLILGLHYLITERRPVPWPAVITFAGLVLPWYIFSSLYFGSLIPATLAVKQQQGLMAISQRFAQGFLTTFRPYAERWDYRIEALYGLLGLPWAILRARRWLLFLSWGGVYFVAFALLGVSRYYWYYAPFVPVIVVLAGLGITALVSLARQRFIWLSAPVPAMLFFILLVFPLLPGQFQAAGRIPAQISRLKIYSALGKWLDANSPPEASVGTLEVGIIGYYSHRTMVDFAGLIQPEVARQFRETTTYDDAALWATQKYRPDFLVLQEGLFPKLEAAYIAHNCRLMTTFEGQTYSYQTNLKVYSCQ
jgi:hypothetical protein